MIAVSKFLLSPDFGPVYTGTIGVAQSRSGGRRSAGTRHDRPRVVTCRKRLQRAYRRGQVRPEVDLDTALGLLYGTIYHHRLLLHTRPLGAEQVATVLKPAFRGLERDPSRAAFSRNRSGMLNALDATG